MTVSLDELEQDRADRARADNEAVRAVVRALRPAERQEIVAYGGPRLRGASVADVLAIAVDNDANLDLTEPFSALHNDALVEALGGVEAIYQGDTATWATLKGYPGYLRAYVAIYAVQACAILTRRIPGRDHVIGIAVDALRFATSDTAGTEADETVTDTSLMERRRTAHKFEGTPGSLTCGYCGLADGAAVHRSYVAPVVDTPPLPDA